MINRLIPAMLAIILVGGCGALALAASGGPSNGSNAAVSQYEPTQPAQGVKGIHKAGGKTTSGAGRRGAQAHSRPVETASTGPVAAVGGLPFTGSDTLILAGIGLLLILVGLVQRRFGSARRS